MSETGFSFKAVNGGLCLPLQQPQVSSLQPENNTQRGLQPTTAIRPQIQAVSVAHPAGNLINMHCVVGNSKTRSGLSRRNS